MPRTARIAPGGMVFHALNRANAGVQIFDKDMDFVAFQRVLAEASEPSRMRILGYTIMPNHWHLVLWPREDGDLARFMQRLTTTHVRRWHLHRDTVGLGHLYQGTYKSFPIQADEHLLVVLRYVERNALRANLVKRAEAWRWSSLWRWRDPELSHDNPLLCPWPIERPRDWLARVNRALTPAEIKAVRSSVNRGRPYGASIWQQRVAKRLGLESTFRSRGRPRKEKGDKSN